MRIVGRGAAWVGWSVWVGLRVSVGICGVLWLHVLLRLLLSVSVSVSVRELLAVQSLQCVVGLLLVLSAAVSREPHQQRLARSRQHHSLRLLQRSSCIVRTRVAREADASTLTAGWVGEYSGGDKAAERLVQRLKLLLGESERQVDHVDIERVGAVWSDRQTLHEADCGAGGVSGTASALGSRIWRIPSAVAARRGRRGRGGRGGRRATHSAQSNTPNHTTHQKHGHRQCNQSVNQSVSQSVGRSGSEAVAVFNLQSSPVEVRVLITSL